MALIAFAALALVPLSLTAALVPPLRYWARRCGLIDDPAAGAYKTHASTVPYGGGLAIFLGAAIPLAGLLAAVAVDRWDFIHFAGHWANPWAPLSLYPSAPWAPDLRQLSQVLCLLVAAAAVLLLGMADDWRGLPPLWRLLAQAGAAAAVAFLVPGVALPLPGGPALAGGATVLWILAFTNAFNFLDNMNGLAAGVAAIALAGAAAMALLLGHAAAAVLCVALMGACGGFLLYNFPAASIFMGDAGGLFLGFLAGSITALLSHAAVAAGAAPANALAPFLLLAVPAYDLVTVVAVRLRHGAPPWVGDTNHVSHRLVRLGLTRRDAVLVLHVLALAAAAAGLLALLAGPRRGAAILCSTAGWLALAAAADWWAARRRPA
ncbi:MAG: MraY family glycosyltransferase [Gemmatimonadota bacterium]